MEVSCSDPDLAPLLPDFRRCTPVSPNRRMKSVYKEETYEDMLARASLQMVRNGLPVEVQFYGVRMLLHLLCFRKEELSRSKLADLRKVLVGSLDDFVLKDATHDCDPIYCVANLKENNKHWRCLLGVLAATETNAVGNAKARGKGTLNRLSNISSNSDWSGGRSSGIWTRTYCRS